MSTIKVSAEETQHLLPSSEAPCFPPSLMPAPAAQLCPCSPTPRAGDAVVKAAQTSYVACTCCGVFLLACRVSFPPEQDPGPQAMTGS